MENPLVSIITPCYNGESYLDRYFHSILNQTYPNLELIFINDGSSDRTEDIVNAYRPRLEDRGISFTYLSQENAGQAAALNRGLKLFTGTYLTWPDADDEMTPDCIEKKVSYLEAHPEFQMMRSNGTFCNLDTNAHSPIAAEADKHPQDIFEQLLLVHTYGCCGCYMITRELFLKCYPDRDIFESRTGQNWQVLVPAASYSQCGYLDESLYAVYEHGDSHSRSIRTPQQMYQRWDLFTEVLEHALEASQCDRKKYSALIQENKARQKFYHAVSVRDHKMLKQTMAVMRKTGKVTMKEYLLFLKSMAFPK